MSRSRRLPPPHVHDGERGAALVEFALVLIPLLILIIGTLAFALTLGLQQSVTHAASAAAREAVVAEPGEELDTARAAVGSQLSWLGGSAPAGDDVVVAVDDRVTVTIEMDNPFRGIGFTARFFGNEIDVRPPAQLRSSATLLRETL